MKTLKTIFFGLTLGLCIPLAAQNSSTPQSNDEDLELAKAKFSNQFPQNPAAEWNMVGDSYVVEFTDADGEYRKIWYDKSGEKQSEERQMNMEKGLPKAVEHAIETTYNSYKVTEITEIKTDGNLTYRVHLNKGGEDRQVFLDSGGEEVKTLD